MKFGISRSVGGTKGVNYRSEADAAAWSYIMAEQLVLGDVVRQLALLMKEEGIVLAFKNEEPWHLLFFRMKQELATDGPSFLRRLRFDADNRYPRCRELSEFLHALHTTCTAGVENPYFDELELDQDVTRVWREAQQHLKPETKQFLSQSLRIACEEFPHKPNA